MLQPPPSPATSSPSRLPTDGVVLVTGGAGFIGSRIALALRREGSLRVVAFDSLRRAGSELNLPALRAGGVEFVRGDVRMLDDLLPLEPHLRLVVDCAADPSVLAGYSTPPSAVVGSNLFGTVNCLELARRTGADVVFLSTSRVYPIEALNGIAFVERETRFEIDASDVDAGVSTAGISEAFRLDGVRSLYGATKLASELLVQEYASIYGFRFVIDRLGVVSGPGQMGKVEQGVFSLWMARHYFGGDLTYRGWGGSGKQVRDLLHIDDVCDLVTAQLTAWDRVNGRIYNAGGGAENSLSLCEATRLCQDLTGRRIAVGSDPDTHPSDVRLYYTDCRKITRDTGWAAKRRPHVVFDDLLQWFRHDEAALRSVFVN